MITATEVMGFIAAFNTIYEAIGGDELLAAAQGMDTSEIDGVHARNKARHRRDLALAKSLAAYANQRLNDNDAKDDGGT